jgi:hypothetical protein
MSTLLVTPAFAAPSSGLIPPPTELLIIVPYKTPGEVLQQENEDWVTEGRRLRNYKYTSGLGAVMITLNDVNRDYEGRDEPERIKRAIYHYAKDIGVKYVMLVGKADLMPVRYQSTGYTVDGDIFYSGSVEYCQRRYCTEGGTNCSDYCSDHPDHCDEDGVIHWCPYEAYKFIPNDAYYANLWDNLDPIKNFDDWDGDADSFFGEYYYDDFRGVDGNTMRPDVALGRVPAQSPEEFGLFINKVMAYEDAIDGMRRSPAYNRALLTASDLGAGHHRRLGDELEGAYEITYLELEDDIYTLTHPDGTEEITTAPWTFISDFITLNTPHFIGYGGHGNPNCWCEMGFGWEHAASLENVLPVVAGTASCSTAKLAEVLQFMTIEPFPVTTSDVVSQSMAEAFVARASGGAAVYLGSVTTARGGANNIERRFFRAMSHHPRTAGDAWLQALESYVNDYDLDMVTSAEWVDALTHPLGGYWERPPLGDYNKMHFFGDPSLRLNGEEGWDLSPAATRVRYERYVHVDPAPQHYRIVLESVDKECDAVTTYYRYRIDRHWSPWLSGSEFYLPVPVTKSMMDKNEYAAMVEYYSVDQSGNREKIQQEKITFEPVAGTADKIQLHPSLKSQIKGKVIDTKGRPLSAVIQLKSEKGSREAKTNAKGWFNFQDVNNGTYILKIAQPPAGTRQYVPEDNHYRLNLQGGSIERGFVFVREDQVAPAITQELTWKASAASGCIYGFAYDDWYGTGIENVAISMTDAKGKWLNMQETWQEKQTWFTPQYVMSLEKFLDSDLSQVIFDNLPENFKKPDRTAFESMLDGKLKPLIWIHNFNDIGLLSKGQVVVHAKATDKAGNTSQIELVNTATKMDPGLMVNKMGNEVKP